MSYSTSMSAERPGTMSYTPSTSVNSPSRNASSTSVALGAYGGASRRTGSSSPTSAPDCADGADAADSPEASSSDAGDWIARTIANSSSGDGSMTTTSSPMSHRASSFDATLNRPATS